MNKINEIKKQMLRLNIPNELWGRRVNLHKSNLSRIVYDNNNPGDMQELVLDIKAWNDEVNTQTKITMQDLDDCNSEIPGVNSSIRLSIKFKNELYKLSILVASFKSFSKAFYKLKLVDYVELEENNTQFDLGFIKFLEDIKKSLV